MERRRSGGDESLPPPPCWLEVPSLVALLGFCPWEVLHQIAACLDGRTAPKHVVVGAAFNGTVGEVGAFSLNLGAALPRIIVHTLDSHSLRWLLERYHAKQTESFGFAYRLGANYAAIIPIYAEPACGCYEALRG